MKAIVLSAAAAVLFASAARAEPATLVIPAPPSYAPPPHTVIVADPPLIASDEPPPPRYEPELYRSPFRLLLGPMGATTGRSMGFGMGVAADFGRDSVGFRLAASWLRGESQGSALDASPIGDGLAQYTGELTLDFHKQGPVHPIFGLGFGLAHVSRGDQAGNIGIGTARLGLEYALAFDGADVRLGAGVTGALPGPSDREVADVKGYALVGATIGMGF
jgi:hypothetical protein